VFVVPAGLPDGPISIGRPIANTELYVLDAGGNPPTAGVVGELYIGGAGVARGYLNRPDLTAERFVTDPFSGRPAARMYRTGDLARFTPEGVLDFLGRMDDQVKIRGYRIEPGEIEAVLCGHASVGEAVVVAMADGSGSKRLVGYVTAAGEAAPSPGELRRFAARALPSYMVPSAIVVMDALPLTPNGKIDRRALPSPSEDRGDVEVEYVAPRDDVETRLVGLWEDVLGIRGIGVTDEFWDLGVDSLAAAHLFTAVERAFERKLPLAPVFQAPSIEKLAALIRAGGRNESHSSLVVIQAGGERAPVYCIHGGAGTVLHLRDLARHLGPDQPFYGLQCRGLYGGARPITSIPAMAKAYIRDIRSVQPTGPYRLLGYCLGGVIAYEMAQQLRAAGEEVELLGMLSTVAPSYVLAVRDRRRRERLARLGQLADLSIADKLARERERTSGLPAAKRIRALSSKARRSVSWHAAKWRERAVLRVVLTLRPPVPEGLRHRFFRVANGIAEKNYRAVPYPGRVVLWFAQGMDDRADLGWRGLPAEFDIRPISGAHRMARDLTMEPSVGVLASMIREELDHLDRVSS
jgi:thioesterase domain-containing protein/acyl carrier protein